MGDLSWATLRELGVQCETLAGAMVSVFRRIMSKLFIGISGDDPDLSLSVSIIFFW